MDLYEYQAKRLFKESGLPVQDFAYFRTLSECESIISSLELKEAVLKVQVLASGRGKAGGVKFAKNAFEILEVAKKLLGMRFVNKQTTKEGVLVDKVLISSPLKIIQEYYLAFLIDRELKEIVLIASKEGGIDIEEVAKKNPEKILKISLKVNQRIGESHLLKIAQFLEWNEKIAPEGKKIVEELCLFFNKKDLKLLEINPFAEIEKVDGKRSFCLVDAKVTVDDNALFRQAEIEAFFEEEENDKNSSQDIAKKLKLSYVPLEGKIGCMVNGAGLAMATMDIIHDFGGEPANFLDLGGTATQDKMREGFKLIMTDPHVKGIFVNIFGGIVSDAAVAAGIIAAVKEISLTVPLVVRMEGTDSLAAKELIRNSGLKITLAEDMADGAKKIVAEVNRFNGDTD